MNNKKEKIGWGRRKVRGKWKIEWQPSNQYNRIEPITGRLIGGSKGRNARGKKD